MQTQSRPIVISDAEKAAAIARIRLQLAAWFRTRDAFGNVRR